MNDYFDVYVGNLAVSTSREQLSKLFLQFGEIKSVWLKTLPKRYTSTYAFVTFYNLNDAKEACAVFNNKNLDGFILKVHISRKTQERLSGDVRKKTDQSILRNEHVTSGEKLPRNILKDKIMEYQKQDNDFIQTYVNATCEMKDIAPKVMCPPIINTFEKPNLETLESIVVRYYKPVKRNYLKAIDFDLSHRKVLTVEENEKFFVRFSATTD